MSKVSCEVIYDILPLYVDGITNEETNKLVEDHLSQCDSCRQEEKMMRKELQQDGQKVERTDDERVLRSFKKKIRRKNILVAVVSAFIVIALIFVGLKLYMNANRPDINGNEFIASFGLTEAGAPKDIIENTTNGLIFSKEMDVPYISIPVNSKTMTSCHVRLLRDDSVLKDTEIPVSEERFVSFSLDNLSEYEEGMYMLEYYGMDGKINQYKWFLIKKE